ncbi:hypothetical protein GGR50DRAFT_690690 [Xylaria sp. CBS 124048]|nr:hypothetical protein GGR50DRAFT_690690 [Xylaria sp. CBS 124048]
MLKPSATENNAELNPDSSGPVDISTKTERESTQDVGPCPREPDVSEAEVPNESCGDRRDRETSSGRDLARNQDTRPMDIHRRDHGPQDSEGSRKRLTPEEYISYKKDIAVEEVMAIFQKWFDRKLAVISYLIEASEAADETGMTRNSQGGNMEEKGSGRGSGGQKRGLSDEDSGGLWGDGSGRDGVGNKRAKKEEVLLVCPFFKHNPDGCRKPGCRTGIWKSIHRLKEHLYRVHLLPQHKCPRCNSCFDSDKAIQLHLRADEACKISNATLEEGIDQDTERKLRERKKYKSEQPEVERWRDIYMLLFPGVDRNAIPSSYPDCNQGLLHSGGQETIQRLKRMKRRMTKEIPKLVKKRVEERFDQVGAEILRGINDIVSSSLNDFFRDDMLPDGGSTSVSPSATSRETTPGPTAIRETRGLPSNQNVGFDINIDPYFADNLGMALGGDFDFNFDVADFNQEFNSSENSGEECGVDGTSLELGGLDNGQCYGISVKACS